MQGFWTFNVNSVLPKHEESMYILPEDVWFVFCIQGRKSEKLAPILIYARVLIRLFLENAIQFLVYRIVRYWSNYV